jgi:hypothetical protein
MILTAEYERRDLHAAVRDIQLIKATICLVSASNTNAERSLRPNGRFWDMTLLNAGITRLSLTYTG